MALEQTDGKPPLTVRDLHFEMHCLQKTVDAHPHHFAHCSILSHTVFLEVTSNHSYLSGTTTTNHKGFTHFIQTSLSLRGNYLFGHFSSTRNNCTKIKRSLQTFLVCIYTHTDFFKMHSIQKKINIKISSLANLFSAFSSCNAITSVVEAGHTSRS